MSLNSIKFETTDIALLFKNSLVDIDGRNQIAPPPDANTSKVQSMPAETTWKYLGENKKRTLIVVRYADAIHLPDKQLSFLIKLLAACNLNLADVAIFNFHGQEASSFTELFTYFNPKTVLLFAVKPSEFGMPMNFPEFQVQAHKDALFVTSPALETIEPDKNLKGKLWASLKKIYNL